MKINILFISLFFVSGIYAIGNNMSCMEKLKELKQLENEKEWDTKQKYMLMLTGRFLTDFRKQTKLRDEKICMLKMELKECK